MIKHDQENQNRLVYGFHSINSLLQHNPQQITKIYCLQSRRDKRVQQLLGLLSDNVASFSHITLKYVTGQYLDQLIGHKNHQGVIALCQVDLNVQQINSSASNNENISMHNVIHGIQNFTHWLGKIINNKQDKQLLFLLIDGVTDVHNFGAIIRTANCFAVNAIIVGSHNCAPLDNPIVAKASSGAIYSMPIVLVHNLVQSMSLLKENGVWIVGSNTSSQSSTNMVDFHHNGDLALVVGSEGSGISRLVSKNCDYNIYIPMLGDTNSLNVSVATGVILSHLRLHNRHNTL